MCSRPRSTLTAYLMRELIRGHQRESMPDEGAHPKAIRERACLMRELIRGNQQRLLSRDLDRVLDLEFPRVLITDGVNSPVMPMPLRGDRHCERLPTAPTCIPEGVSRLDDETRLPKRDGAVQPPGRAPRRLHMHACNQGPSDCNHLAIMDYNEVASSGHERPSHLQSMAIRCNQMQSDVIRGHQRSSAHLHEPRPHVNRIG